MKKLALLATVVVGISFVPLDVMSTPYALEDIDGVRIIDSDLNGTGDAVQRNQLWSGNIANLDWGVVFVYDLPELAQDEQTITAADFSALQDMSAGNPDLLVSGPVGPSRWWA